MYNNTQVHINYKPYIPPPKKNGVNNSEEKQSEKKGQNVNPNNYSQTNSKQQSGKDSFVKTQIQPPPAINIKQVLIDFNSTLNAIGAPPDVEQEAKAYLVLVEHQAQKENPNKKMIVSNLKIAADVLDEYITETLKKPSKVVKDWIDALLLQSIDFKVNEKITKGAFETITGTQSQTEKLAEEKIAKKEKNTQITSTETTSLPEQKAAENLQPENNSQNISTPETPQTEQAENVEQVTVTCVQTNPKVIELIAKSEEENTTPRKALDSLSTAFKIAQSENDKASIAIIYSKIATVHNTINNIPQALECLNASTKIAYALNDDVLKTQNHKQMGKIYDEVGFMETALEHYCTSLGIDGELDDTANQADTLNSIGKMYSDRYVKNIAVDFYKDALELAKETKSLDVMSESFYNTAMTMKKSGEKEKAMTNLKNAAALSTKSGNNKNLAEIYEEAGDLMKSMNYSKKAADLYKKSYRISEKTNNNANMSRLQKKLAEINH